MNTKLSFFYSHFNQFFFFEWKFNMQVALSSVFLSHVLNVDFPIGVFSWVTYEYLHCKNTGHASCKTLNSMLLSPSLLYCHEYFTTSGHSEERELFTIKTTGPVLLLLVSGFSTSAVMRLWETHLGWRCCQTRKCMCVCVCLCLNEIHCVELVSQTHKGNRRHHNGWGKEWIHFVAVHCWLPVLSRFRFSEADGFSTVTRMRSFRLLSPCSSYLKH